MPINIRESFLKDAIEEYASDVSEEEEQMLRGIFEEFWQNPLDDPTHNLAVLAFVAGRTFGFAANENSAEEMYIKLKRETLEKFIEFLVDGAQ